MNVVKNLNWIMFWMVFGLLLNINKTFAYEKLQSRHSVQPTPSNQNLIRIRFGTVIGSPPFGFLDRGNKISGLNVDLVRRICALLATIPNCEIQAISPEDAEMALKTGTVDALVSAIAPSNSNRFAFKFSEPFAQSTFSYIENRNPIKQRKHGFLDGMFDDKTRSILSNNNENTNFKSFAELFEALTSQEILSAFVPSYAAQFWVLSDAAEACCHFKAPIHLPFAVVSPYRVATKRENTQLHTLIENALYNLENSGGLDELRKRYLPLQANVRP